MTLQELEHLPKEMLVPTDIAPILGCTPYTINVAVKKGIQFPFPVLKMGTRVRIPKRPFINYMKGK